MPLEVVETGISFEGRHLLILYPLFALVSIIFGVKNKYSIISHLINLAFIAYILALVSVTIFPISIGNNKTQFSNIGYNLIPLSSILNLTSDKYTISFFIKQVVGNIILFIPLGLYLSSIKKYFSFKKILLIGFIVSMGIEITQTITSYLGLNIKIVDIDDVVLNLLGIMVGFLMFISYKRFYVQKMP